MISKLQQRMERLTSRSLNIIRHIGWSIIFKLGSIIANFILVPLAMRYLGTEDYGVWLTLSSVLTWFILFDIGLGNGLRNKFAEAKALGNYNNAKEFVSTAYYTIAMIAAVLVLTMCVINQFVDWTSIFNITQEKADELKLLMPVVFGFFCMQLVLKLVTSIYLADQHHSVQDKIQFCTQTLTVAAIALVLESDKKSLLLFGSVYMVLPVVVLVLLNMVAFNGRYANYRPNLGFYRKKCLSQIGGLGIRFFIIQVAAIVLFSTDNFIILQLYGPAEVVPYNIAFKYFSIVTLGFGILTTPFWSSFTEAWLKDDKEWINRSVSIVRKAWIFVPLIVLLMIAFSEIFYAFWVHDAVYVPASFTITCGLYVMASTYGAIYVNFINGIDKVRLQLVVSVVVIFVNIPLSIFLAKYMNIGASGVMLATVFCIAIPAVLWQIQFKKLINGTAKGIWSK